MTIAQQQSITFRGRWFGAAARSTISLWFRRIKTRRDLSELAAYRLADIGLTEDERDRECAKWFWQK